MRDDKKFLTLRAIRDEYGINYLRVWGWIRDGKIAFLKDGTRRYLIKRSDLDAFIAKHMGTVR